ncbi:MAG TPA: hypothetical protein VI248_03830 [Kineosporiaceae bacterium]
MSVVTAPPASSERAAPRVLPLRWEILAVVLGAVGLACWTDRGALSGLTTTAGGDLGDPLYFAWELAWVRHAVLTDPGGLWTTPAFLQAPDNLAFTDTVLGYTPLGLLVPGGQSGALAVLNLAGLAATAAAVVGGYALARAMGSGRLAGLVAGAGFGFAPWRLEQTIHINVISTGGIALALALLSRGNGWSLRRGWQPGRMSPRWIAAGWGVACYQLLFGWATGIWFVYALGLPMVAWTAGWLVVGRRRAALPRGVLLAHGLGGLAFVVTGALLLRPYLRVVAAHPEARRGENWLPLFSPPWRGLLTAPTTSWYWGGRQLGWRSTLSWPPEMILSPGVALLVLALTGLVFSVWPWRRRLGLGLATAVLTVLAMGTAFPFGHGEWTYLPLYRYLPGWSALRTPGRLMIWVTLGLCLLAAGAVARFSTELRPARRPAGTSADPPPTAAGPPPAPDAGPPPALDAGPPPAPDAGPPRDARRAWREARMTAAAFAAALLTVVPSAVVVGEGLGHTPHWPVARSPIRLTSLRQPILLLPTDLIGDYQMMLWQSEGWPVIANGNSGFDPTAQTALRSEAKTFPDAASVAALRARGIVTVVVVRPRAVDGPWADAAERPVTGLGISRTDLGDAVVFTLTPGPAAA